MKRAEICPAAARGSSIIAIWAESASRLPPISMAHQVRCFCHGFGARLAKATGRRRLFSPLSQLPSLSAFGLRHARNLDTFRASHTVSLSLSLLVPRLEAGKKGFMQQLLERNKCMQLLCAARSAAAGRAEELLARPPRGGGSRAIVCSTAQFFGHHLRPGAGGGGQELSLARRRLLEAMRPLTSRQNRQTFSPAAGLRRQADCALFLVLTQIKQGFQRPKV